MKYLKKVLISLLLVVFLTGCFGGNDLGALALSCTMTDTEEGALTTVKYNVYARGDEVTGTVIEMDISFPDDTASEAELKLDAMESMYAEFEETKGVTFDSKRSGNSLNLSIEYNLSEMDEGLDELDFLGAGLDVVDHVEDMKSELESDGFTCK